MLRARAGPSVLERQELALREAPRALSSNHSKSARDYACNNFEEIWLGLSSFLHSLTFTTGFRIISELL